jgi:hypothetical protein
MTGKPKRRKETPSPSSTASVSARKRKKGIWPAVGVGPPSAGGKRTGPRRKAGAATSTVTIKTLTQVFTLSTPFGSFITGSASITHGIIAGIGVGGVGSYDVADPSECPTRADPESRRDNEPQDAGQDATVVKLADSGDYRAQDRR